MQNKFDFSRFKSEINLTQYAAHLGYQVDREKSTRSSIVMRKGKGRDRDKIIVSRRGKNWVYFSVTDDSDNGTIINFIQKRTQKSIGEIGRELQSWVGGSFIPPIPSSYVPDVQEQQVDPVRVQKIFKQCTPAFKHPYLEGRGIAGEVLSSARFRGRVFVDRYQNAAFAHYNENGICGLELKNAEKAVFVRGSEKTFWRSNSRAGDKILIISEAVIDVLSHSILFPTTDAMYLATGGGISPQQSDILQKFISNFSSLASIILITDNDQGGDKLAARLHESIVKTQFSGLVSRHSPNLRGQDWNDVLCNKTP